MSTMFSFKLIFSDMKRLLIILSLAIVPFFGNAQPDHFRPERLSDDEIIQMQTRDMVSWLELDGKTKDRFVKEYTDFRKAIDGVAKNARPPRELSDEKEIDKAIQQNFIVSEQILQIRKEYYARFKEFLKPSQIQKIYGIEREAGRRMQGGPGGPGAPLEHDGPGGPDAPGGPGAPGGPKPRP